MIYKTNYGDTLDYICWKHYGKTDGIVEKVLTLNRHLSALGAVFDAGILIELPEIPAPTGTQKIKLWQ